MFARPCRVYELFTMQVRNTTEQWILYNIRLPLILAAIFVITNSTTGPARLFFDLYFSLCKIFVKPELHFLLQLTKIPLVITSATATS